MTNYQDDMSIIYDSVAKSTLVNFQGELHYLIGPFSDRDAAIAAGEEKCRCLGWQGEPNDRVPHISSAVIGHV